MTGLRKAPPSRQDWNPNLQCCWLVWQKACSFCIYPAPMARKEPALPAPRQCLPSPRLVPAYTTRRGRAYQGDALDVLRRLPAESVALVLTSPPFALQRKKAYGNVTAAEYVDWFWPFAEAIHRVLRP